MEHDFKRFPELSNNQMQFYYFDSPHEQIFENFDATVTKVIDGDTVKVKCDFRNFEFRVRLKDLAAAELGEGGEEAKNALERKILHEEVMIMIDKENRVGKYGRLIGDIIFDGESMSQAMIREQHATTFLDGDNSGSLIDIDKIMLKIDKEIENGSKF